MAAQQKAVFVKEVGKPVELGTKEVPSPKEGEVLLKVAATMCKSDSSLLLYAERGKLTVLSAAA